MMNINDYLVTGATIGMCMNNATSIIINSDLGDETSKDLAEKISLQALELLKAMCKHGLIPKRKK